MTRRGFLAAAVLAAPMLAAPMLLTGGLSSTGMLAQSAHAADKSYRLSGPYMHKNLAIYLIHRSGTEKGPVPLTLAEAMKAGVVKVIETGKVNRLVIRNTGDRDVFIQAGDIVKGGKQDRVLTISMIVPPRSGAIPVGAFCVERDRWAKRGSEKVAEFSASSDRMPSKAGKLAMMERARRLPTRAEMQARRLARADRQSAFQTLGRQQQATPSQQGKVWASVKKMQRKLASNMKVDLSDKRSRSSLQLSLENKKLAAALKGYKQALGGLVAAHPDAVGYVFAINGKINSGDEFGSAGLFRKLWLRQLKAAATEAIAEDTIAEDKGPKGKAAIKTPPTTDAIAAFLDKARAAKPAWKPMPGHMRLETRETKHALYTEARKKDGAWVHRNFIAQ